MLVREENEFSKGKDNNTGIDSLKPTLEIKLAFNPEKGFTIHGNNPEIKPRKSLAELEFLFDEIEQKYKHEYQGNFLKDTHSYNENNLNTAPKNMAPPPPPPAPPAPPKPSSFELFAPKYNKISAINKKVNIADTNRYTIEDIRNMNINENGIFLGIVLGRTTRDEAISILSNYSTKNFKNESGIKPVLVFDDIALTVYLNNQNIVEAIEFNKEFKGKTIKGLKIGDPLEKAVRIYGSPKMSSCKGAFWDDIKIFFDSSEAIASIKIQA